MNDLQTQMRLIQLLQSPLVPLLRRRFIGLSNRVCATRIPRNADAHAWRGSGFGNTAPRQCLYRAASQLNKKENFHRGESPSVEGQGGDGIRKRMPSRSYYSVFERSGFRFA
jgi:hypothetical protein